VIDNLAHDVVRGRWRGHVHAHLGLGSRPL
jgi:hypothetical protein